MRLYSRLPRCRRVTRIRPPTTWPRLLHSETEASSTWGQSKRRTIPRAVGCCVWPARPLDRGSNRPSGDNRGEPNGQEGWLMFSRILVAVGSPDDAHETVPVVTGLAKAFDSTVLGVHMRARVVTSVATLEKESIPESFRFGEEVAQTLREA